MNAEELKEKRRKIREGLTLLFDQCYSWEGSACPIHPIFQPQRAINLLLSFLSSEGVVLRGDKELPPSRYERAKVVDGSRRIFRLKDGTNMTDDCLLHMKFARKEAQQDMLKAGYVYVESLIGDDND